MKHSKQRFWMAYTLLLSKTCSGNCKNCITMHRINIRGKGKTPSHWDGLQFKIGNVHGASMFLYVRLGLTLRYYWMDYDKCDLHHDGTHQWDWGTSLRVKTQRVVLHIGTSHGDMRIQLNKLERAWLVFSFHAFRHKNFRVNTKLAFIFFWWGNSKILSPSRSSVGRALDSR